MSDAPKGPTPPPKSEPRICAYCGEWYANWDEVMAHVEICPKADDPPAVLDPVVLS